MKTGEPKPLPRDVQDRIAARLRDMQARGIPLHYRDELGRHVAKHPDGRIEVIRDEPQRA